MPSAAWAGKEELAVATEPRGVVGLLRRCQRPGLPSDAYDVR